MSLALLALAGTAAACSSGPQVTAQQKRAVAGILNAPKDSSTPSAKHRTTIRDDEHDDGVGCDAHLDLGRTGGILIATDLDRPRGRELPAVGPGRVRPDHGGAGSTAQRRRPEPVGGGESAGDRGVQRHAQPWGGSCSTPGQVMQQVPPQGSTVQLFYCTKVT